MQSENICDIMDSKNPKLKDSTLLFTEIKRASQDIKQELVEAQRNLSHNQVFEEVQTEVLRKFKSECQ